jgi:hypothetical protein
LRYLSVEVLPKGMPPPCEHVVVDTAQGEDIHHAGGASVTCARNTTNTVQRKHKNSRGSYDAFKTRAALDSVAQGRQEKIKFHGRWILYSTFGSQQVLGVSIINSPPESGSRYLILILLIRIQFRILSILSKT